MKIITTCRVLGLLGLIFIPVMLMAQSQSVLLVTLDEAIGPATQAFVTHSIAQAEGNGYEAVVIKLNTPGGLVASTRGIVQAILASPVPIITYVAPSGARAASAGTFILYASHIAAMAPGTHMGSATPVALGGAMGQEKANPAMSKKAVGDAVAYISSLAELRGRNLEWGKKAVMDAVSISAKQALSLGVIDVIADTEQGLLAQIDQHHIKMGQKEVILDTQGAKIKLAKRDWYAQFIAVITNPNIAYFLLILGFYGLIFEFMNPGIILPGVVGAISLLLALYALQMLPVSYVGLALLIFGLILMIMELLVSSFGILGIAGVVAFVLGSIFLFDSQWMVLRVAWPLLITLTVVTAGMIFIVLWLVIRSHRKPPVSGMNALLHQNAVVTRRIDGAGEVLVQGEYWQAKSDQLLEKDIPVRVVKVDGLCVWVEPVDLDTESSNV